MSTILVIGSSNTDLIAKVNRFPLAGETVSGQSFMQAMGGKGANQALAAHRAGGKIKFLTCLGTDANGRNTLQYFSQQGMDVSLVRTVESAPTGTAMILVNAEGENCIVVTPGANHELSPDMVKEMEKEFASASIVVLQMEIPYESVRMACALAKKNGKTVLLNVAPARKIDADLMKMIDILVVNETEIEEVSGLSMTVDSEERILDAVIAMGAKTVILTLGKKGCRAKGKDMDHSISAFDVIAVDTTAAGDTFCGALVAQLSNHANMIDALQFATAAAALCVTRMGAQPSIPTATEVTAFLHNHKAK